VKFEAMSYQQYCINKIMDQPEIGLFLDMGMGKTVITLTAIEQLLYDCFEVGKVLVIAPLRPAAQTWPEEIRKWDHLQNLRAVTVLGSVKMRQSALEAAADIFIINRDNVSWLVNHYQGKRWPFDTIIIDELSSFKAANTRRFKALRSIRPYVNRIIGLTGTPAPNGLLDLWPQLYLLDQGRSLGRTLTGYRDQYFLPDKRNAQIIYSWKPRPFAEDMIYELIADTCISMKSQDFLTLPERLKITHKIQLPGEAREAYDRLERDLFLDLDAGSVDALNAGVLVNKLMQVTGGSVYDTEGEAREVHSAKLEALDDLIEAANGQPVLVFYAFRHELSRILSRYSEARDIREKGAIEAWNAGQVPILVAHPASAGHGLNLQAGGHIVIWYGLTTSLELYQQANKRLHRMGQRETVLIHHLVAEKTIDEKVLGFILEQKTQRQDALIEAVKARMGEVL